MSSDVQQIASALRQVTARAHNASAVDIRGSTQWESLAVGGDATDD
jgi:hypothetical protein